MDGPCGGSGSNMGDAIACPARLVFQQGNETGEYAERGNELHEFARKVAKNPESRAQALLDIEDDKVRATAMGMDVETALDGITERGYELAFVLNVKDKTCRFLGENIHRGYAKAARDQGKPLTRYDIPFATDVVGKVMGDVPAELDYKSGRSIGPPDEHWQRRICTAGLMYYYDTPSAVGRVGYIWEDGSIHHDGHEFTVIDADGYCDELVEAVDRIWEERIRHVQGVAIAVNADRDAQCKYCNAFKFCPYWNNLARSVAVEMGNAPDLTTMTAEERGRVLDRVKDVLKVYEKLESDLREHVEREALPVNDKQEFRSEWQEPRNYFDAATARGLLVTALGKAGKSDEEIKAALDGLYKKGKPFTVVSKRKRQLPVVQAR